MNSQTYYNFKPGMVDDEYYPSFSCSDVENIHWLYVYEGLCHRKTFRTSVRLLTILSLSVSGDLAKIIIPETENRSKWFNDELKYLEDTILMLPGLNEATLKNRWNNPKSMEEENFFSGDKRDSMMDNPWLSSLRNWVTVKYALNREMLNNALSLMFSTSLRGLFKGQASIIKGIDTINKVDYKYNVFMIELPSSEFSQVVLDLMVKSWIAGTPAVKFVIGVYLNFRRYSEGIGHRLCSTAFATHLTFGGMTLVSICLKACDYLCVKIIEIVKKIQWVGTRQTILSLCEYRPMVVTANNSDSEYFGFQYIKAMDPRSVADLAMNRNLIFMTLMLQLLEPVKVRPVPNPGSSSVWNLKLDNVSKEEFLYLHDFAKFLRFDTVYNQKIYGSKSIHLYKMMQKK